MLCIIKAFAILALIRINSSQFAWDYQPELMESSTLDPFGIFSTVTTTISPSSNPETSTIFLNLPAVEDYTDFFEYEEIPSTTVLSSTTLNLIVTPKIFVTKIIEKSTIVNIEGVQHSKMGIFLILIVVGIILFFVGSFFYCIFCCKECKMLGPNYENLNRTGNSFLLESAGKTEVEIKDETMVNLPRDGRYTATNLNYPGPSGISHKIENPGEYIYTFQ